MKLCDCSALPADGGEVASTDMRGIPISTNSCDHLCLTRQQRNKKSFAQYLRVLGVGNEVYFHEAVCAAANDFLDLFGA